MRSKSIKKTANIILVIVLVLGLLSSVFGVYAVAFAGKTPTPEGEVQNSGDGSETAVDPTANLKIDQMPDFGSASNEAELADDVKVFTEAESDKISSAIESVESNYYDSYNEGGRMELILNGTKEELLGDLESGDYFMISGKPNTPLAGTYIMKAASIYEYDDKTELDVVQPELGEVFENLDIGFHDALKEENLISANTIDGVDMHFGDAQSEITGVSYTESFDTGSSSTPQEAPAQVTALANDYSTEPTDLIINLDIDLEKSDEGDNDDDDNGSTMDFDADGSCKLNGKIGIEDLSAYMVCDMPSPGQFNELMFGVRGKKVVGVGFESSFNASFNPEATKLEYDGLFIDVEVTGLNKKWIPLGIWQFAGTTAIKVTKDGFDKANALPSIFVMLYMDAEGEFEVVFNASLTYESTFNSGLNVIKNGEIGLNLVNYPYASENGKIIPAGQEGLTWEASLELDMNATLTLLGSSVQFYIAGINIGEVQLIDIGVEADGHIGITANDKDGIQTSNDNGETSYYIRMFLKALGFKAKVSAEVEAFQHEISGGVDIAYQLLDITLFVWGKEPDKYQHRVPVSSKWVPAEFGSVVCLVNDISGSMSESLSSGGTKLDAMKEASHVITQTVEKSADQYDKPQGLAVVKFDDTGSTVAVPHNDYEFLNDCIDTLEFGGGTNIKSGLNVGVTQLIETQSDQKVIILMTDGEDIYNSDSEILEEAERAKENNIKVFTIGFGDSVNESLLTQIAQTTGGEYRHSATDSIVGIIGSFLYSYEAANGDVLVDRQSEVAEGETVDVDEFDVPDNSGDLNASVYYPGSLLDLILIDPNGRTVDEEYPGATLDRESIPATATVKDPLPGEWKFAVKGIETSYEKEPFYAIASFKEVDKAKTSVNPPLSTITIVGAYCLPIGVFMILISAILLVMVNKKKKS